MPNIWDAVARLEHRFRGGTEASHSATLFEAPLATLPSLDEDS